SSLHTANGTRKLQTGRVQMQPERAAKPICILHLPCSPTVLAVRAVGILLDTCPAMSDTDENGVEWSGDFPAFLCIHVCEAQCGADYHCVSFLLPSVSSQSQPSDRLWSLEIKTGTCYTVLW